MIRFLLQTLTALALVVGGSVVAVVPAHASSSTSVVQASEAAKAAPNFSIQLVAPQSPSAPMPKVIGAGGIKPLYTWLPPEYCYWSGLTIRSYYCYRYGCTYFERIAWGCYDGYVRINTVYWA
jgi:hypothetical protein